MYASASLASLKSNQTTAITIAAPKIDLMTSSRNNSPTGVITFTSTVTIVFEIKRLVDESYS